MDSPVICIRLRDMLGSLVDLNQCAFTHGIELVPNVMLSQESTTGYVK